MSRPQLAVRTEREAGPGPTREAGLPEAASPDRAGDPGRVTTGGRHRLGAAAGGSDHPGSSAPGTPGGTGQPTVAGALLQLQRTHGNRYVQRLLEPPAPAAILQPKLRLGPPGDRYEREADQLAEDLTSRADSLAAPGRAHRPARLAPRAAGSAGPGGAVDPAAQQLILAAQGQGRPLPGSLRRRYEQGLGAGFAAVRLHTDSRADRLNLRLRSSAVTTGHDIFFRRGEYDPGSDTGGELLAHELVHVAQQAGTTDGAAPLVQRGRNKPKKPKKKTPAKRKRRNSSESESGSDDSYQPSDNEGWSESVSIDEDSEEFTPKTRSKSKSAKRRRSSESDEEPVKKRKSSTAPKDTKPKSTKRKSAPTRKKPPPKRAKTAPPATTEVPVVYRDLNSMKAYLADQGLTTNREPTAVSVGVVVWNINHLKADDDAVPDDVPGKVDESAVELDEAAQGTAKAQQPAIDTDAVNAAMKDLKQALKDATGPLTKAAEGVIAQLDTEKKKAGKTPKDISETRKEVSQLQRDLAELERLRLDEVLTPGIAALTGWEKDGATSEIGLRAEQLENLRGLNRVVKRLLRLRSVLLTGQPRLPRKIEARTTIRKALAADPGERMADAIDRLLKHLDVKHLQRAVGALKQRTVVDVATRTFFGSEQVNLVLINEMNLGIRQLATAADQSKGELGLSQGPLMLAKGRALAKGAKGKAGVTVGTGDDQQQVTAKQYEYYPAVHRAKGKDGLTARGTFYVSTHGQFAVQEEQGNQNNAVTWDKKDKTYRGIVVHRYVQNQQEFWAGILHTTPAGKDLDRKKIWPQIKTPLDHLNQLARHFKIPLLVGGDFYIPAEGIVTNLTKEQRAEIKANDPHLLNRVKSWNFARNIFLTAENTKQVDALIANVEKLEEPAAPDVPPKVTAKRLPVKTATPKSSPPGHRGPNRQTKTAAAAPRSRSGKLIKPPMVTNQPSTGAIKKKSKSDKKKPQTQWERYVQAILPKVSLLVRARTTFSAAETMATLAPHLNLGDIAWSTTRAGGEIGELDIQRNYNRQSWRKIEPAKPARPARKSKKPTKPAAPVEEPRITMQRALGPLGYRIVDAGSPTNPKESGRGENKMQLADLFLVNEYWKTTRSGLVTPGKAQLKPIDDAQLSATRTYWKISDHSPVLLMGSTADHDLGPYQAFNMAPSAAAEAVAANQAAWAHMGRKLAKLSIVDNIPVAREIEAIQKILGQPLTGPDPTVTRRVRAAIDDLTRKIVKDQPLTDKQKQRLEDLEGWDHPYYTVDFGEERPTETLVGPDSSQQKSGQEPPPGQHSLPGSQAKSGELSGSPAKSGELPGSPGQPAQLTLPGSGGQLPATGGQATPAWPTGEMVNSYNSCYLAALVHVFASHQSFRDLLDPQKHQPDQASYAKGGKGQSDYQKGIGFQATGQLRTLVTRLQNPLDRIDGSDMRTFMRYLDKLGGVLTPAATLTKDSQVAAQATKLADKAIVTESAFGDQQDAAGVLTVVLDLLGAPEQLKPAIRSTLIPELGGTATISTVRESVVLLPLDKAKPAQTITEALHRYSAVEHDVDYKPSDTSPSAKHRKQLQFDSLPEVLTIALSRFDFTKTGQASKIDAVVHAEDLLVIPDECLTLELRTRLKNEPVTYSLHHFVRHSGKSIQGGHYTSYGKLTGTGPWYEHNDAPSQGHDRRNVLDNDDLAAARDTAYVYIYVRNT